MKAPPRVALRQWGVNMVLRCRRVGQWKVEREADAAGTALSGAGLVFVKGARLPNRQFASWKIMVNRQAQLPSASPHAAPTHSNCGVLARPTRSRMSGNFFGFR